MSEPILVTGPCYSSLRIMIKFMVLYLFFKNQWTVEKLVNSPELLPIKIILKILESGLNKMAKTISEKSPVAILKKP